MVRSASSDSDLSRRQLLLMELDESLLDVRGALSLKLLNGIRYGSGIIRFGELKINEETVDVDDLGWKLEEVLLGRVVAEGGFLLLIVEK